MSSSSPPRGIHAAAAANSAQMASAMEAFKALSRGIHASTVSTDSRGAGADTLFRILTGTPPRGPRTEVEGAQQGDADTAQAKRMPALSSFVERLAQQQHANGDGGSSGLTSSLAKKSASKRSVEGAGSPYREGGQQQHHEPLHSGGNVTMPSAMATDERRREARRRDNNVTFSSDASASPNRMGASSVVSSPAPLILPPIGAAAGQHASPLRHSDAYASVSSSSSPRRMNGKERGAADRRHHHTTTNPSSNDGHLTSSVHLRSPRIGGQTGAAASSASSLSMALDPSLLAICAALDAASREVEAVMEAGGGKSNDLSPASPSLLPLRSSPSAVAVDEIGGGRPPSALRVREESHVAQNPSRTQSVGLDVNTTTPQVVSVGGAGIAKGKRASVPPPPSHDSARLASLGRLYALHRGASEEAARVVLGEAELLTGGGGGGVSPPLTNASFLRDVFGATLRVADAYTSGLQGAVASLEAAADEHSADSAASAAVVGALKRRVTSLEAVLDGVDDAAVLRGQLAAERAESARLRSEVEALRRSREAFAIVVAGIERHLLGAKVESALAERELRAEIASLKAQLSAAQQRTATRGGAGKAFFSARYGSKPTTAASEGGASTVVSATDAFPNAGSDGAVPASP